MKKICFILGTRPEIIKLSPIIRLCQKKRRPFMIIHTNQHYSANMDRAFFTQLHLPHPKHNLGIRESLHGKMTARMVTAIEKILMKEKDLLVLVQGDTNTVLAGGLAAAKLQIPVGHVEAGLRSYDRTMPEEINRVLVDHVSELLFCPTKKQLGIAMGEGIQRRKIMVTGNTIVDAVLQSVELASKKREFAHYAKEKFMFLTLHRPANVDTKKSLSEIMRAITDISKKHDMPVYFPAHPRTRAALKKFKIKLDGKHVVLLPPVSFFEMLMMEKCAVVALTDSGGIQEEACILRTPCVTIRNNTERPETVEVGANIIAGTTYAGILRAVGKAMKMKKTWKNPLGKGDAAARILKACA